MSEGIKMLHEVYGAEEISKLKGFKVVSIEDGASEDIEYIEIKFIGPNDEEAVLIVEDAVMFYGNELE